VSLVSNVDLPTDGKPTRPTRVSPDCQRRQSHAPSAHGETSPHVSVSREHSNIPLRRRSLRTDRRPPAQHPRHSVGAHMTPPRGTNATRRVTLDGITSSVRSFANLAFRRPMWRSVALLRCGLDTRTHHTPPRRAKPHHIASPNQGRASAAKTQPPASQARVINDNRVTR
jgi:hypothetical protein